MYKHKKIEKKNVNAVFCVLDTIKKVEVAFQWPDDI